MPRFVSNSDEIFDGLLAGGSARERASERASARTAGENVRHYPRTFSAKGRMSLHTSVNTQMRSRAVTCAANERALASTAGECKGRKGPRHTQWPRRDATKAEDAASGTVSRQRNTHCEGILPRVDG